MKPHDVLDRLTKSVSEEVKDHSDLDEALSRSDFPGQYRPFESLTRQRRPAPGFGELADRNERSAMLSQMVKEESTASSTSGGCGPLLTGRRFF